MGGGPDRLGLRDAARRRSTPPPHPAPDEPVTPPGVGDDDEAGLGAGPPIWRRVPPARTRRTDGSAGADGSGPDLAGWRTARPAGRRPRLRSQPAELAPPRPAPLPPDAAVLRLVCDPLEGVDAGSLQTRLLDLAGVQSVAIDLYDRTVDLYLDRARAAPAHLVALATERLRLPVRSAEIHRAAAPGQKLGDETRLFLLK